MICLREPAARSRNAANDKSDARDGGCAMIGTNSDCIGAELRTAKRSYARVPIKMSLSIEVMAEF